MERAAAAMVGLPDALEDIYSVNGFSAGVLIASTVGKRMISG